MSFYVTRTHKYKEVPEDGAIETEPFLLACQDSIIPLLDILGSTAFSFVKADVNGNIQKLFGKLKEDPEKYSTLTGMVLDEIAQGTTMKANSATDALLWLTRGLNYMNLFIYNMLSDEKEDESLKSVMQDAYNKALKPHHPWVVHKGVQIAFMAMPYRKDVLASLGMDTVEKSIVIKDIGDYQTLLKSQVDSIREFYQSHSLSVI